MRSKHRERIRLRLECLQLFVHRAHELVEMHAGLPTDRHGGEERVHDEALATTDAAKEIDPARHLRGAQQSRNARLAGRTEGLELLGELLQPRDRRSLRVIERCATACELAIEPGDEAAAAQ